MSSRGLPLEREPPHEAAASPRAGRTTRRPVEEVTAGPEGALRRRRRDELTTEEPLEIRLVSDGRTQPLTVTMRTPGSDFELVAGFLFAEGIVSGRRDIVSLRYCVEGAQRYNVVNAHLAPGVGWDPAAVRRHFAATSSCGVCGKASIEAARGGACSAVVDGTRVRAETLLSLPARLAEAQPLFRRTGGLHAAALFDAGGALVRLREDVGRHNALDKLVGAALLEGELPLTGGIVLMSGRLSFELVQKAARAGAPVLAGVSAPSSLAVELACDAGLTLVGFLRERRFNIYAGGERIT